MLSTCQDNMSKILHYFDIFYVCRCYRHERTEVRSNDGINAESLGGVYFPGP